jgi:hypothetical protein
MILLSVGCATAAHGPPQAPTADGARAAVAKVIHDQYAAVERGDLDAWGQALAPDIFLFGSDPGEATAGKDALMAEVKRNAAGRMSANISRSYRSQGLEIGLAPGNRAAWATDDIQYTLTTPKGTREIRFRMSALLGEREGRWSILAAHYSVPISHQDAFKKLAAQELPAPRDFGEGVLPGAAPLRELYQSALASSAATRQSFSERQDVIVIGTASEERWKGGVALRQMLVDKPRPAGVTLETRGGLRAGLSQDGQAGWVAANLVVHLGASEIVFRSLEFFIREGGAWRAVCEHNSVGVPD